MRVLLRVRVQMGAREKPREGRCEGAGRNLIGCRSEQSELCSKKSCQRHEVSQVKSARRGCTSDGRVRVRAGPVRALRMQAEREGRTLKGNEAQESSGSGQVATPGRDNGLVGREKP